MKPSPVGYQPLFVFDDDPTGIQSVRDCLVLTRWSAEAITRAIEAHEQVVYLLTNTRALNRSAAADLITAAVETIEEVCRRAGIEPLYLTRSDSTLRGHFPLELECARAGRRARTGVTPGPVVFCPAFIEGGRFTREGVHYATIAGQVLPADQTEFSRDPEFGYPSSTLRDFVAYRTAAAGSPLRAQPWGTRDHDAVWIPDVEDYDQLDTIVAECRTLIASGVPLLFQTAASFVRAWMGLSRASIDATPRRANAGPGIVVVGSFVEMSTRQLEYLLEDQRVEGVQLPVDALATAFEAERGGTTAADALAVELAARAGAIAAAGRTPVIYTSRELRTARSAGADAHRALGALITRTMIGCIKRLPFAPAFFLAKGGITSHVLLADALEAAEVRAGGAVVPGVPAVRVGAMDYVIFPGNVGDRETLRRVFERYCAAPIG